MIDFAGHFHVHDEYSPLDGAGTRNQLSYQAVRHGQTHLGIPIKFEDEPGAIRPVAPALGEHSRSALANVGYEKAELDAMARSGAIR